MIEALQVNPNVNLFRTSHLRQHNYSRSTVSTTERRFEPSTVKYHRFTDSTEPMYSSNANGRRGGARSARGKSTTAPVKEVAKVAQEPVAKAPNRQESDTFDKTCPICHEEELFHAIPPCNHHICFRCSVRLRYLHHQFYCPICRAECPKVLIVNDIKPYDSLSSDRFIMDRKAKVWLEDQNIKDELQILLAHNCRICLEHDLQQAFKTFKELKDHVRKEHQLHFCDICVDNIKLLSSERKLYTRESLGLHKRKGDKDDTSFKGHPLCQICDKRFLDTDELWRHLRKDHFYCHFCDADGEHIYFGSYDDVKVHFRESHYLCEEDECAAIQFTNAFRSELDLKAHKAQYHVKGGTRSQQRQARTLELEFNFGEPRRNVRETKKKPAKDDMSAMANEQPKMAGRGIGRFTQEEMDTAKAIAASMTAVSSAPQLQQLEADVQSKEDFPSLGRAAESAQTAAVSKAYTSRRGRPDLSDQNEYPSLAKPGKPSATQSVVKKAQAAPTKAKSNPWSNDDEEFPSLEGSKAKAHAHGWHLQKPEPTRKQSALSPMMNHRPAIDSAADFPSLGGAASLSGSLASLGSWINNKPNIKTSQADRPTSRKTPAPYPFAEDAPAKIHTVQSESVVKEVKKKKKVKGNSSSATKATTDVSNCDVIGGQSKTDDNNQKAKSKKQSKKMSALESEIMDECSHGSSLHNSVPDRLVGCVTTSQASDNAPQASTATSTSADPPSNSTSDIVVVTSTPNIKLSDTEYPSLSRAVAGSAKLPTKKPPPGLGQPVSTPPGLSLPSQSKPPPGLSAPPGFSQTFNLDSVAQSLVSTVSQSSAKNNLNIYVEPPNFTQRSKKLQFKLKELIYNDTDQFWKFKNLTLDFRSDSISANSFYTKGIDLLGKRTLMEILPELLALLPDVSKQQQLYKVCADDIHSYQSENTASWRTPDCTGLVVCNECNQVLLLCDLTHHETAHGVGTEDYPALATSNPSLQSRRAWQPV